MPKDESLTPPPPQAPPADDDGAVVGEGMLPPPPVVVPERGSTPPPHDYVLGAGPAATRNDFVQLRTKFERDEIGDNSAVLGAGKDADKEAGLPDRRGDGDGAGTGAGAGGGSGGGVTFDSQERLMAGGDGSGAISDAAMSATAASIAEEGADVPSLERDPVRDRY